jgi:hypothetical protein
LARAAQQQILPGRSVAADVEQQMRKKILRTAAYILLFVSAFGNVPPCYGETNRGWKKKWILAAVALTAANVLDVHSSRRGNELNPLLRGPDGNFSSRKAFVVKSAASGGFLVLQVVLIKKMPDQNLYKPFAITTAAAAGFTAVSATRNYALQRANAPAYLLRPGTD